MRKCKKGFPLGIREGRHSAPLWLAPVLKKESVVPLLPGLKTSIDPRDFLVWL